jgi:hypothetical protein
MIATTAKEKLMFDGLLNKMINNPTGLSQTEKMTAIERIRHFSFFQQAYHDAHKDDGEQLITFVLNPEHCSRKVQDEMTFRLEVCSECRQIAELVSTRMEERPQTAAVDIPVSLQYQMNWKWQKIRFNKIKDKIQAEIDKLAQTPSRMLRPLPAAAAGPFKPEDYYGAFDALNSHQCSEKSLPYAIGIGLDEAIVLFRLTSDSELGDFDLFVDDQKAIPIPMPEENTASASRFSRWIYDFYLGSAMSLLQARPQTIRVSSPGDELEIEGAAAMVDLMLKRFYAKDEVRDTISIESSIAALKEKIAEFVKSGTPCQTQPWLTPYVAKNMPRALYFDLPEETSSEVEELIIQDITAKPLAGKLIHLGLQGGFNRFRFQLKEGFSRQEDDAFFVSPTPCNQGKTQVVVYYRPPVSITGQIRKRLQQLSRAGVFEVPSIGTSAATGLAAADSDGITSPVTGSYQCLFHKDQSDLLCEHSYLEIAPKETVTEFTLYLTAQPSVQTVQLRLFSGDEGEPLRRLIGILIFTGPEFDPTENCHFFSGTETIPTKSVPRYVVLDFPDIRQ